MLHSTCLILNILSSFFSFTVGYIIPPHLFPPFSPPFPRKSLPYYVVLLCAPDLSTPEGNPEECAVLEEEALPLSLVTTVLL